MGLNLGLNLDSHLDHSGDVVRGDLQHQHFLSFAQLTTSLHDVTGQFETNMCLNLGLNLDSHLDHRGDVVRGDLQHQHFLSFAQLTTSLHDLTGVTALLTGMYTIYNPWPLAFGDVIYYIMPTRLLMPNRHPNQHCTNEAFYCKSCKIHKLECSDLAMFQQLAVVFFSDNTKKT